MNDPLIIDARCLDLDGACTHRHPTGSRLAIAAHHRMATLITGTAMALEIRLHFDL
jgi:hypothetical protein